MAVWEAVLTDEPLQNLLAFYALTNYPCKIDVEYGLHVYGYTAMIFVLGLICLIVLAMALTSPPPPVGTSM